MEFLINAEALRKQKLSKNMSVQFGRWNFDGRPIDQGYVDDVRRHLAPYGPDGVFSHIQKDMCLVFGALHTTRESRSDKQPYVTASRALLQWDGRLDNREDLVSTLKNEVTLESSDAAIAAAGYERWGVDCFARFVGDWALSIWDPSERSLILAKDPIGIRHLYYSFDDNHVSWSTILDPLVVLDGQKLALNEEYIAGWLANFPAVHLTPYAGIQSVPPSCSLRINEKKGCATTKYWDFDPAKTVRYQTDPEYEEHFRAVFGQAVQRRLRSDRPILAELSGGMDSSSIVCTADSIIEQGGALTPRLETLSYYDDSEPNWNERPYFLKVEEKRGRAGCHIDVARQQFFRLDFQSDRLAATPSSATHPTDAERKFAAYLNSSSIRVVLSGVGGDEVMGGVPTPIPELEDLLARARFRELAHQLKIWALNKRKPWFHLLNDVIKRFLPWPSSRLSNECSSASWLDPGFLKRNRSALCGYRHRLKLFGALPSFQESLSTLGGLRRQLECYPLASDPPFEKRYPFLDRDLLEFVYAVPRNQFVRPGQRRSLMRRALSGIVPDELLNRKRKAYANRRPMQAVLNEWNALVETLSTLTMADLGIVNSEVLYRHLQRAHRGEEVPMIPLMRTIGIEFWLRHVSERGLVFRGHARSLRGLLGEETEQQLAKQAC